MHRDPCCPTLEIRESRSGQSDVGRKKSEFLLANFANEGEWRGQAWDFFTIVQSGTDREILSTVYWKCEAAAGETLGIAVP